MRKRLYDIIEVKEEESLGSTLYDAFMLLTIIASIIPLCFKKQTAYMEIIDQVTVIVFIIDSGRCAFSNLHVIREVFV